MTGYGDHLSDVVQRELREKAVLGDDPRYVVKGDGATSFQLDSGKTLRMRDVLLLLGMTSNLVAVSALEDEGYDLLSPEDESSFKSMVAVRGLRLVFVTEVCTDCQLGFVKPYYMIQSIRWSYGMGGLLICIIEPFPS